jgi:DNA-binding MarR family transcriptional regulator
VDNAAGARNPNKAGQAPTAELMTAPLPLPTLLSQAVVAFTIEFDNEFEHRTPHRTTLNRSGSGPWLTSMVMWWNCMRFVREAGITVGELEDLASKQTNWNGMERWGYIVVAPDPADSRPKPPRRDWVVHATAKGRKAQEIWAPLFDVIETRWRARFGQSEIDRLSKSLSALDTQLEADLPDCLPILCYGMSHKAPDRTRQPPPASENSHSLIALLSRVLLAFALEFERESDLSLAISANVIRLLNEEGLRVRDLPRLSGVSKEAIAMSVGFLEKGRYVVVAPDPAASRTKLVRLTPKGREAQVAYLRLLDAIEKRWQTRFGSDTIRSLRNALERLVGEPTAQLSPLFRGLDPYPDGWRASVPKPATLPHYPMVLHRGGYPDGS